MKFFKKLIRNNKGATAIEYGLIAALIAVAAIGAISQFSTSLKTTFTTAATQLDTANKAAA